MGDLSIWNVATKSFEYVVQSVADKRSMFNDVGAVVALAQSRHVIAVAFRNHRVALYDACDVQMTLNMTRFVDVRDVFESTGLIRDHKF